MPHSGQLPRPPNGLMRALYEAGLGPVIGREFAVALGILWLGLLFLLSVLGGLIYLIRHDYHVRFKEAVAAEGAV